MLNRRQFLLGAAALLASTAGCNLKARLPANPGEPQPLQEEGPRPLLRVALLSDPHTVAADSSLAGGINGKLVSATLDLQPLKPDLWLVNGDIADRGRPEELAAFKQIMAKVARPEQLLVNTGNHDFYDAEASDAEELRRFQEAFGLKTPYTSRVAGDFHMVMLSSEQYKSAPGPREWAWLTPEQLRWFEQILDEHREKLTAVCLHQPLQDTVVWSHGGNDFAGCGQAEELRAILRRNPQVRLWFSGHTHMGAAEPGNVVQEDGVTFVGLSSTFYQFVRDEALPGPSYDGYKKNLSANQSRVLELWPDRLLVRARDCAARAWMEAQEVVLQRS